MNKIIAALLLTLAMSHANANSVINSFSFNDSDYFLLENVTYDEAVIEALNMGGTLAIITSQAENDAIFNALKLGALNAWHQAFIGINDIDNEGTYLWADGTDVFAGGYTNFWDNEPNNHTSTLKPNGEDAGSLYLSVVNGHEIRLGRWNDHRTNLSMYAVVEINNSANITANDVSSPLLSFAGLALMFFAGYRMRKTA